MAGACAGAALALASPAGPAAAFPDGAPWSAAEKDGCMGCHFDGPLRDESRALTIEGLPERIQPETRYSLTLRLRGDSMETAGFLLKAEQTRGAIGRFEAGSEAVETKKALARSVDGEAGLESRDHAVWKLDWRAPARIDGPVRFILWANAGNGDASPFGDSVHRRIFLRAPGH